MFLFVYSLERGWLKVDENYFVREVQSLLVHVRRCLLSRFLPQFVVVVVGIFLPVKTAIMDSRIE